MSTIEWVFQELPIELRQEVLDFAHYLLETKVRNKSTFNQSRRLSLSWAGALSQYKDQFTSIELQKQALDWWGTGGVSEIPR